MTGGWTYVESAEITPEIKKMFEDIQAYNGDPTYIPIANVGSQVVAGTNHAVLCKVTINGNTSLVLVYVYEDLEGNCQVTNTEDIKLSID
jgi:hypothetical protein